MEAVMRVGLSAAIDRRLTRFILGRGRRRSPILNLLPAQWLEPFLAPRVRRLRIKLIVAGLALTLLLVAALVYLSVGF
jgi:hypothetical protein